MTPLKRLLVCSLTFLVTLFFGVAWVYNHQARVAGEQSMLMNEIVNAQARAIERRLSRSLLAASFLAIEVTRQDPDFADFDRLAGNIIDALGGITNLQLAPGGVVTKIYPLAGHEAALGFDIINHPERRAAALAAIEGRRLSLAGPFELVQGGIGIIGRHPVFVQENGEEVFWGFTSVLIVLEDLLEIIDIGRLVESGYAYQISHVETSSGEEVIFSRSESPLGLQRYGAPIVLADRKWNLVISRGDDHPAAISLIEYLLAIFISALIALALYLVLRQNQILLRAREEADRANRDRSAFMISMSHEIRTPLTGLLGVIHLLKRSDLSPAQRRYVDTASTTGNMLMTVINDLLDISRIDSDDFPLESVSFEITELIEDVASVAAAAALNKRVDLVCDLDHGLPYRINGDPQRLRQVLNNLLSNSIEQAGPGQVVLSAIRDEEQIEFAVKTMPQPTIVSGTAEAVEAPGAKLERTDALEQGMQISRRWIEAMGGKLEIDDAAAGEICYRFRLDIDPAEAVSYDWNPPETMRDFSICVLSPNRARRQSLLRTLHHWKIEQTEAYAFDAETDEPPADARPCDLVIVDQVASNEKVGEFIEKLRNTAAWRDTRFIQLVPQGANTDASKADLCLQKPVAQGKLYGALMEMLYRISLDSEFSEASAADANGEERPLLGRRLLLAEDNDINKIVALEILEETGAAVDVALNGVEAVDMARANDYDLILMDIQMPLMDGYEASRQIRVLSDHYARVPIIAMTAHAQDGEKGKSLEAGMDRHVAKPFDPDQLLRVVVELVRAND